MLLTHQCVVVLLQFMLNDRTVLQYGFLQSGPVEKLLSGLDRHDYKPDVPWEELPAGEHGPLRFEGARLPPVNSPNLMRLTDCLTLQA